MGLGAGRLGLKVGQKAETSANKLMKLGASCGRLGPNPRHGTHGARAENLSSSGNKRSKTLTCGLDSALMGCTILWEGTSLKEKT